MQQSLTFVSKEHVCKDEWSAYCWDKSWGSCPVTCTYEETYCYSTVYDSTGLLYAAPACPVTFEFNASRCLFKNKAPRSGANS